MDSPGLYEEGFAYVAASVQYNGLYGYPDAAMGVGLTVWDSARYGDLHITDDALSFDIFTQIARAVGKDRLLGAAATSASGASGASNSTNPTTPIDPMGGLKVEKVFGVGESQSGSRILSYANGVQPIEGVFDALVPVVCAARATDFARELSHYKEDGKTQGRTISAKIREDIACKVFIINSQTEANTLGSLAQPDTANIVSWQVAGASHLAPKRMETVLLQTQRDGIIGYDIGEGELLKPVDWTNVYEAALVRIQEWIDDGTQPPAMPPLSSINMLLGYFLDQHGNVKGGVRLPELTATIATYDISLFAGLNGKVTAFTQKEILALYPTHQDYVAKVAEEAHNAAAAGIILPYRADEYVKEAQLSWVASIWTDEPAVELLGGGSSFNVALFVFVSACVLIVAALILLTLRVVRAIKNRRKSKAQ
ncbi:MAG: hypothetical protein LBH56_01145, partial [Coriobacteriales bacterium]|jgi:hypothetical protein|nr:hypothetical protein [Coriobacteriales bacterium]